MSRPTASFEVQSARPEHIVEAATRRVGEGAENGILFVSGALTAHCHEIAQDLALETRGTSWLIAPTAGVLSERGEVERDSAAVGLLFGGDASLKCSELGDLDFGESLVQELKAAPGASVLALLRSDRSEDAWLSQVEPVLGEEPRVFGGGTLPQLDIHCVQDGIVRSGGAAAVVIKGSRVGRFRSSSACRLLGPLGLVTQARGPMLHEIDHQRALERLKEVTADLDEHPLVLLAMAGGDQPLSSEGRHLALQAIQGVDPSRGSLIMGSEVQLDSRVAFAVRDPHSARTDLDAQLRSLNRYCAGTAPEFGLYVNCAGRGRALYKSQDVDVRLIRAQFPGMPFIGLSSTFELAPLASRLVPQIYTGVLGVFCRPS